MRKIESIVQSSTASTEESIYIEIKSSPEYKAYEALNPESSMNKKDWKEHIDSIIAMYNATTDADTKKAMHKNPQLRDIINQYIHSKGSSSTIMTAPIAKSGKSGGKKK